MPPPACREGARPALREASRNDITVSAVDTSNVTAPTAIKGPSSDPAGKAKEAATTTASPRAPAMVATNEYNRQRSSLAKPVRLNCDW